MNETNGKGVQSIQMENHRYVNKIGPEKFFISKTYHWIFLPS